MAGTQGSGLVFQPRIVLLPPQGTKAVWDVGMGCTWIRMSHVMPLRPSPQLWQLRSLCGGWNRVEVFRVLMLDPT